MALEGRRAALPLTRAQEICTWNKRRFNLASNFDVSLRKFSYKPAWNTTVL